MKKRQCANKDKTILIKKNNGKKESQMTYLFSDKHVLANISINEILTITKPFLDLL